MGCGTESLGIVVSELLDGEVNIHGLDLSDMQLGYAADKVKNGSSLNLYKGSMDMLPFMDGIFDIVVTSVHSVKQHLMYARVLS